MSVVGHLLSSFHVSEIPQTVVQVHLSIRRKGAIHYCRFCVVAVLLCGHHKEKFETRTFGLEFDFFIHGISFFDDQIISYQRRVC